MGEVEGKIGRRTRSDLRHDWPTVSLLTDHLVFSPKYRGGVLEGKVAEAAEEVVIDEGNSMKSSVMAAWTIQSKILPVLPIVTLSPYLKSNIG
jgi:hypothetical protein